jgi:hypothetical protein
MHVKETDIKVRMPRGLKLALEKVAAERLTTVSEIMREAAIAYVTQKGFTTDQIQRANGRKRRRGRSSVGVSALHGATAVV